MIKEHLNKDGSLDMRYAENQHYEARNLKRGILLAIILGFLVACIGMTFIMRPKSVKENIFENVEVEKQMFPTIAPEPTQVQTTKPVVNYTYTNHAGKPYYDEIIAELRMRYVNWQDAAELVGKESGFDPGAINPSSGACGIPQALPCTKMGCSLSDINCQLDWQWDYIADRYGNITKALAFHRVRGWY